MSGRLDITTTTAIRRALSEVPTLRKGLVLTLLFALIGTAVHGLTGFRSPFNN